MGSNSVAGSKPVDTELGEGVTLGKLSKLDELMVLCELGKLGKLSRFKLPWLDGILMCGMYTRVIRIKIVPSMMFIRCVVDQAWGPCTVVA
jgi:hypothetical protein